MMDDVLEEQLKVETVVTDNERLGVDAKCYDKNGTRLIFCKRLDLSPKCTLTFATYTD